MKNTTLVLCCLIAVSITGCGKKSKKGGQPQTNQSGIQLPGQGNAGNGPGYPGQNGSCWESVSQNGGGCNHGGGNDGGGNADGSVQNLVVSSSSSWRYTDEATGGSVESAEKCLQGLQVRGSQLELGLNNMGLRNESSRNRASARCLVQAQVSYPRGWAFAIRKISAEVTTSSRTTVQARFEGTYQIDNNAVIAASRSIDRSGQATTSVQKEVGSEELDWSSCEGSATIAMHTVFNMQASSTGAGYGATYIGEMSVKDYRFEIVWAKCRSN